MNKESYSNYLTCGLVIYLVNVHELDICLLYGERLEPEQPGQWAQEMLESDKPEVTPWCDW
jgi:hypothetical protein